MLLRTSAVVLMLGMLASGAEGQRSDSGPPLPISGKAAVVTQGESGLVGQPGEQPFLDRGQGLTRTLLYDEYAEQLARLADLERAPTRSG